MSDENRKLDLEGQDAALIVKEDGQVIISLPGTDEVEGPGILVMHLLFALKDEDLRAKMAEIWEENLDIVKKEQDSGEEE